MRCWPITRCRDWAPSPSSQRPRGQLPHHLALRRPPGVSRLRRVSAKTPRRTGKPAEFATRPQCQHGRRPGRRPHVSQLLENVRETFAHLPKGELTGLVKLLSDERKHVHLIGGRFTDGLARYMAAHLRIVRANVNHVAGQQGNWLDQLIGIGPKDVVVVFDIRRYQAEIIQFAEAAARQGATVALVTDSWMSPVGASPPSFCLPASRSLPLGTPRWHSWRLPKCSSPASHVRTRSGPRSACAHWRNCATTSTPRQKAAPWGRISERTGTT